MNDLVGSQNDDELYRLCDSLIESKISASELGRLDDLLVSDAAARVRYVQYMALQSDMVSQLQEAAPRSEHSGTAPPAAARNSPARASTVTLAHPKTRRWWMAAAAVLVAMGLSLRYGWLGSPAERASKRRLADREGGNSVTASRAESPRPPGALARIEPSADARFCGDGLCARGGWLKAGALELTRGRARLVFDNGAQVSLRSPANVTLLSGERLQLSVGSLAAFIPHSAAGFTVVTSAVQVIDHGTEFGVTTSDVGDIEVHVLDGEIELAGNVPGFEQLSQRLTAGSAVRVRKANPLQWEKLKLVENPYRDLILSTLPKDGAQWNTLIEDHFDRGLDRNLWTTVTERVTDGFPRVFVRDGHATIMDSAYLVTRQEIDPVKLGGIRIRGRWRYRSGIDMLSIVTRADPVPTKPYGHCASGIEFGALAGGEHSFIAAVAWGACQTRYFAQPLAMRPGEEYEFEVLDMPQGFSFEVRCRDTGESARIVGTASGMPPAPHVVIHNMNHRGPYKYMISEIDNLQISQFKCHATE